MMTDIANRTRRKSKLLYRSMRILAVGGISRNDYSREDMSRLCHLFFQMGCKVLFIPDSAFPKAGAVE
jgi:tRNA A37 threonylcarbamoyltransferase TsaD